MELKAHSSVVQGTLTTGTIGEKDCSLGEGEVYRAIERRRK